MPLGKTHDSIASRVFGVIPMDLNAEMDKASKALGSRHRMIGHDDKEIERITQLYKDRYPLDKLNQPLSYYLAKLHLTCDFCPAHPDRDNPVTMEGEATNVSQYEGKVDNLSQEVSAQNAEIKYLNDYIWLLDDKLRKTESENQQVFQDLREIEADFGIWLKQYGSAFGVNVDALFAEDMKDIPARLRFKTCYKFLLQKLAQIATEWKTLRLLRESYTLIEKPRSIEPENKKELT